MCDIYIKFEMLNNCELPVCSQLCIVNSISNATYRESEYFNVELKLKVNLLSLKIKVNMLKLTF